ncbi:E3 ubiquitin-protein ligase IAP-3 [Malacosoma neustria nucleopolyhedrovirus]|uniref:E3 ubiquitin-protein ligase IAP-3 n=1 Tax=Malacosoma neustria nuclear polyhedrosis virus TaxID=38012 RepID=UPI000E35DD97|nr:E3 ubiquitin-protein ligase IAP-3 [Malacosoma neustria nucleopolyhedrovirus]AUF81623.1 E3 ubiquitin-protein ligase IAP-3 [Malacosoma neustria nucleopolyhedrovirus]
MASVDDSILKRINTFIGWNVSFITPDEMAHAGFYYTKHKDYVRCAFCNIELGNWTTGKSPIAEHAYYSPDCNYIAKLLESFPSTQSSDVVDEHERSGSNDFYTCTITATSSSSSSSNMMACVVCMDRDRCIMFTPCKHIVCCDDCAVVVDSCVVCRSLIEYRTKIFLN